MISISYIFLWIYVIHLSLNFMEKNSSPPLPPSKEKISIEKANITISFNLFFKLLTKIHYFFFIFHLIIKQNLKVKMVKNKCIFRTFRKILNYYKKYCSSNVERYIVKEDYSMCNLTTKALFYNHVENDKKK